MIPKRKPKVKMGVRTSEVIRCPAHLAFVRSHECACKDKSDEDNWACHPVIEAAHIRVGTDGGTGKKPSDCFTLPLCSMHHMVQHRLGERSFEARYRFNMLTIAKQLWDISPAGKRYRAKQQAQI